MPRRKGKAPKASTAQATAARKAKRVRTQRERNEFEQWQDGLTARERHVEEVAQRMRAGRWVTGFSHRERAQAWGLAPGTVEHIAAEASRQIRRDLRLDDDSRLELRARICQTIESIQVRAIAEGTPNGLRTALQAVELLGRYWGVEPPKALVVQPKGEFDGMSDEEVEAVARGEGAEDGERPEIH